MKNKACLSYKEWLIKEYKKLSIYPYIQLCALNKLDTKLDALIKSIVSEIKEVFFTDKYYLRYDLTLPFINKGIDSRSEIGYVYRLGPEGNYRWREFLQADSDCIVKEDKAIEMSKLLNFQIEFLDSLPVEYSIHVNHLSEFCKYMNLDSKAILKKIDLKLIDLKPSLKVHELITEYINKCYSIHKKIIDCSIVRGLHMYNGLVYEIYFKNCKFAMGAGGEYALNSIRPGVQYIGGSLGLSRIDKYLQDTLYKIPYICYKIDFESILNPFLEPYCIDTSFKNLIQKFIKYPVIIIKGKKEVETNTLLVKYIFEHKQQYISVGDLAKVLRNVSNFRKKNEHIQ